MSDKTNKSISQGNYLHKYRDLNVANRCFRVGVFIMLAAIIADLVIGEVATFQAVFERKEHGIGFSSYAVLAYWISLIFFCFGAKFYSRAKGYPPTYTLLGLANAAGFVVLLLLPDKRGKEVTAVKTGLFTIISSMFIVIASIYWVVTIFQNPVPEEVKAFIDKPIPFSDVLSTHYSLEIPMPIESLDAEKAEIKSFIEEGLSLAVKYDDGSPITAQIIDQCFGAVAVFEMLEYRQKFLKAYYRSEPMPENSWEVEETFLNEVLLLLERESKKVKNHFVFLEISDWLAGEVYRADEKVYSRFADNILKIIYDQCFNKLRSRSNDSDEQSVSRALEEFAENFNPQRGKFISSLRGENNQIIVQLKEDLPEVLRGKTIIFGAWLQYGTFKIKEPIIRRIGGTLSEKYLRHRPNASFRYLTYREMNFFSR